MEDQEYKITWFHMETTHKEDYRQLEYICPKPKLPAPTCRNIISHERTTITEPPACKVDVIQPDVMQEYCIQGNVDVETVNKHPQTFVPFTSEDVILPEDYLRGKEDNLSKKTNMIEKCKFSVQLSAMKELETYPKVIEYTYKSTYKADFSVDGFQFKKIVFSADDYKRKWKLKPPPSEPTQILHNYLVPAIATWKTIQSNNTAALKDAACSQPW
ncbi:uncharacterized protein LOC106664061 isoform X2 [Cimex lectularius]|uniref:Uncharacterized protein n=1 Tax=Cimex lectularius TaxID=79782 RepID=A0A8I6RGS4_CIMLE|nr:uncharacterized protein LOC106664061 isoform X2 [Cimex lectularius]